MTNNLPVELMQVRIAQPGWRPGRSDISELMAVWSYLTDFDHDVASKKIAKMDAPAAKVALSCLETLDSRGRAELTRPVLKAAINAAGVANSPLPTELILASCRKFLTDREPRIRKSAAQAIGSSFGQFDGKMRSAMTAELIKAYKQASDASEIKALTDSLGKTGSPEALEILKESSGKSVDKAAIKLQRDLIGDNSLVKKCLPGAFVDSGKMIVWFTRGVEKLAKEKSLFSKATSIEPGVLVVENMSWLKLEGNNLWRRAGFVIGETRDHSPGNLALILSGVRDRIFSATEGGESGNIKIRLGRKAGVSRGFIWDFAQKLMTLDSGLINDGRAAAWELESIGEYAVLIPLQCEDRRFSWRNSDVDGASDPTIAASIVELARIAPNDVVFDPFCGAGTELILAARLSPKARLIGTDIDEQAIRSASESVFKAGVKVEFFQQNGLNFTSTKVDVVISNPPFGMRTIRGEARAVLEDFFMGIRKKLNPNGRVVILSHAPSSTQQWAEAGGLKLSRTAPIFLGRMPCELQLFVSA